MKISQKKIFFIVIIILVLGVFAAILVNGSHKNVSNKYDTFATCLKEKGVIFYGAFWCAHCNATKEFFGSSQKLLPYVECSTPDGGAQTQECIDKKITGYPTWVFPDGSRINGEITEQNTKNLQILADKTSCILPK